jgi:hypothetical protein
LLRLYSFFGKSAWSFDGFDNEEERMIM